MKREKHTTLSWDGSCCWWWCWTIKRTKPATEKEARRSHIQLNNLLLATLRLLIFPLLLLSPNPPRFTLNPDSSRAQWIRTNKKSTDRDCDYYDLSFALLTRFFECIEWFLFFLHCPKKCLMLTDLILLAHSITVESIIKILKLFFVFLTKLNFILITKWDRK